MGIRGNKIVTASEQITFRGEPITYQGEPITFQKRWEFLTDEDGEVLTDENGTPLIAEIPEPLAGLLLKTVIVPGPNVTDGQLIEAVAIPWFEIIFALQLDPGLAFEISARKWEEIVAAAYKQAGFDEVILTPRSADLGRDVIAIKKGLGTVRVVDQVKAYKPGNLVTANDVRALLGILDADGASKGFITTTSDFAPLLKNDRLISPWIPTRLELINGQELLRKLHELAICKK